MSYKLIELGLKFFKWLKKRHLSKLYQRSMLHEYKRNCYEGKIKEIEQSQKGTT